MKVLKILLENKKARYSKIFTLRNTWKGNKKRERKKHCKCKKGKNGQFKTRFFIRWFGIFLYNDFDEKLHVFCLNIFFL